MKQLGWHMCDVFGIKHPVLFLISVFLAMQSTVIAIADMSCLAIRLSHACIVSKWCKQRSQNLRTITNNEST